MVYNKNVLGWLAPDARNAMTWVRIMSFNFRFLYYILLYLFNMYFFRYCTDGGTHRVLRILRMDLFLFNFLYEAVATLQVTCTLYMQLTFYRGTIIQAINSNGLDVTNIKSISNGSRKISSRFLKWRTTSNASSIHFYNSNQPDEICANTDWFHISMKDFI